MGITSDGNGNNLMFASFAMDDLIIQFVPLDDPANVLRSFTFAGQVNLMDCYGNCFATNGDFLLMQTGSCHKRYIYDIREEDQRLLHEAEFHQIDSSIAMDWTPGAEVLLVYKTNLQDNIFSLRMWAIPRTIEELEDLFSFKSLPAEAAVEEVKGAEPDSGLPDLVGSSPEVSPRG